MAVGILHGGRRVVVATDLAAYVVVVVRESVGTEALRAHAAQTCRRPRLLQLDDIILFSASFLSSSEGVVKSSGMEVVAARCKFWPVVGGR